MVERVNPFRFPAAGCIAQRRVNWHSFKMYRDEDMLLVGRWGMGCKHAVGAGLRFQCLASADGPWIRFSAFLCYCRAIRFLCGTFHCVVSLEANQRHACLTLAISS